MYLFLILALQNLQKMEEKNENSQGRDFCQANFASSQSRGSQNQLNNGTNQLSQTRSSQDHLKNGTNQQSQIQNHQVTTKLEKLAKHSSSATCVDEEAPKAEMKSDNTTEDRVSSDKDTTDVTKSACGGEGSGDQSALSEERGQGDNNQNKGNVIW